ncbi:MAG: PhoU domain-containing protein [Candidatus Bathyarchaeia archaeon]
MGLGFEMERRRIQLVGRSTLTVSLPASWVKRVGLKKGDLVLLSPEKDGSLRIFQSPGVATKGISSTLIINSDLCRDKGLIGRLITAGYVKGFDVIKIVSPNRIDGESLEAIREAEIKLIGLSIIEETPSSVVLQCSMNPALFPMDVVIHRLYSLFSTILDDALKALMDSNVELAKEAQRREREANRIYALILRLLNQAQANPAISQRIGIYDSGSILSIVLIANVLERMADWANKVAGDVIRIEASGGWVSDRIKARIWEYSNKIKGVCDMVMKSAFNYDSKMANAAINLFEEYSKEAYDIIDDLPIENIYHGFGELRHIVLALHRIGEISISIAEAAIDSAVEKDGLCKIETRGPDSRDADGIE